VTAPPRISWLVFDPTSVCGFIPRAEALSVLGAFRLNWSGSVGGGLSCLVLLLLKECLRFIGFAWSPIFAKLLKIYSRVVWATWYSLMLYCSFWSSIMPKRKPIEKLSRLVLIFHELL